ncbi:hypothetical protein [Clostridium estertheticum]|uniref:hypothetical protein n=1 Tax=Clostridium estertheticum TaxID=238834 RepID=UPI001C7D1424|nr:hypothetical protein [Clostridium estertheticum]MBX4266214.1 hypothetical protein [Clostridium estertheticum]WLC89917.1 hypothetical protein KTC95_06920 [Clostridium estertheticum]
MVYIIKELKQNLLKLNKYSINKSQEAYKLCEDIETKGISVKRLYILESGINELLNIIPSEEYEIQIEITEQIVALMMFWYANKEFKEGEDDFVIQHFFIVQYFFILENYRNLAGLLSMLGICGLSWEYLMKGIWPNYKEETNIYTIYSIWKRGIETIPGARRVIMEVCSCYFYLGRILGHNYEECYEIYKITREWLKIGTEAINADIDYLCFACSLFNSHNNQEMRFKK